MAEGTLKLYDLNQQMVAQLPDMTQEKLDQWYNEIATVWDATQNAKYYLLYSSDIDYFTLFKHSSDPEVANLGQGLSECLAAVAKNIKSIGYEDPSRPVEIWITPRDSEDNIPVVMYLFSYDKGVVKIG